MGDSGEKTLLITPFRTGFPKPTLYRILFFVFWCGNFVTGRMESPKLGFFPVGPLVDGSYTYPRTRNLLFSLKKGDNVIHPRKINSWNLKQPQFLPIFWFHVSLPASILHINWCRIASIWWLLVGGFKF